MSGILIALASGKFVFMPAGRVIGKNWSALFIGLGFISLTVNADNLTKSMYIRRNLRRERRTQFPDDVTKIKEMGVETPVDFSFFMTEYLDDIRPPLFGSYRKVSTKVSTIIDMYVNRKAFEYFKSLFGRMPYGSKTLDWSQIAQAELENELGHDVDKFTKQSLIDAASDEVLKYFDCEKEKKSA